ncbi:MAG: universal stress protein [Thermodesulfobacteriota bacterium]|nr:universal stress protein [Thermodesulfobacteriota bacterium]
MFKRILFATTASPACDHAARVAFDLANRYNAEIITFHVLGIPSRGFSQYVVDARTGEQVSYDDDYLEWVKEEIKTVYAKQIEQCRHSTVEALPGVPHTEILRFARKKDVDLIVMSSATRKEYEEGSPYTRRFAGSTLQAVAKAARCPVLVIGRPAASFWGGISNIVFGTDFSTPSDAAFMFAYKVAKALGCTLYLFHALDLSAVYSGKALEQDEIEERIREARKKMTKTYVSRMEGFKDYEVEIWEGMPYVEIVKFAREKYADLIVMAHHTRETDAEKAQLGSTMEQVILRATCPIISVNHPGKVADV